MSDMLYYPKGRIAIGSGDLLQVIDFSVEIKNSAKLIHTLRTSPSGVTLGPKEATVSFNGVLDENGPERDYISAVLNGTIKQVRGKFPGITCTLSGVFTDKKIDTTIEDAIKFSCNFVGKVTVTPL